MSIVQIKHKKKQKNKSGVSTCQHYEFFIQYEDGTLISLFYLHSLAQFQQVSRLY